MRSASSSASPRDSAAPAATTICGSMVHCIKKVAELSGGKVAIAMQARAAARLVEQTDGALFQDAGADAAEHMVPRVALEDDRVDAGLVQQLAKQQAAVR